MSDYEKIKQLILTLDWENVQLAKELDEGLKTGAWDELISFFHKPQSKGSHFEHFIKGMCHGGDLDSYHFPEMCRLFTHASSEQQEAFCKYFEKAKRTITFCSVCPKVDNTMRFENITFLPF